eukprot:scaffold259671_cov21-Tisochrysis_lutea.AAC.3
MAARARHDLVAGASCDGLCAKAHAVRVLAAWPDCTGVGSDDARSQARAVTLYAAACCMARMQANVLM